MKSSGEIIARANEMGIALPAFNILFPPMMESVVRAVEDEDSFALVETARIEWLTFDIEGPDRFIREYRRCADLGTCERTWTTFPLWTRKAGPWSTAPFSRRLSPWGSIP
jgi:hypothetical protein